ncbi:SDR family oxidoreductase [Paenibacillus kandeliae]|uniref:SDR family oxidoreductase n=1 Tax=Paenibacillus kandeliae TaxID=3231269 RepID=UPI003457AF6D
MKVFVTGATGFVGTAVIQELLQAGHHVTGLARSDAAEQKLKDAGVHVHRGSLEDTDSLREAARAADGIIHLGFIHDFSNFVASAEVDRQAILAMGSELEGTDKRILSTSGTLMLASGKVGTEEDRSSEHSTRHSEAAAEELFQRGVHASVVRLAPTVHGEDDFGFMYTLIQLAREKGFSAYVGDGSNRWPAVHRQDAAVLFRKAIEQAAAGSTFHGVGESSIEFKIIAGVIGRHLNVPVKSITAEQAKEHFGWINFAASADTPISSDLTQQWLHWKPVHQGLLEDLEEGHYFNR